MLFEDAVAGAEMALDERITDFDRTLFLVLCRRTDSQAVVSLYQDELARLLRTTQPRISNALKRLREAGYVKTPRNGRILVSPSQMWRGNTANNQRGRERFKTSA